ncbi:porin family protein [Aquimarina litoralis]|uniref:porin family protein n=1 Tax=Aquimarina litoralis TaxID=584605 RepID=UPI001C578577|nr:porin family protein [Aquimarina litoralis]MBW1295160.1 outer membrane beta-barrel protein [Aquimarina litoralis]
MKKLFLLAIVLIGFTSISNAQSLKLGIKGGINLSTINGDNVPSNLDARTGYHIGVAAQIGLPGKFAIQPELLYSAQGADDLDIDYVNIPILVKYKFLKFLSFEAGPQFGVLVNDDYADAIETKNFDVSAAAGAGVEFGKFFAQARYNFGITDVVDNSDVRNGTFQLSVGYYFL